MKRLKPILLLLFCPFFLTGAKTIQPEKAILINLINNLRKDGCDCGKQQFKSVPPLSKHELLTQAAQRHLQDIIQNQNFSHVGTDGTSMGQRVSETGYVWKSVAENIAKNHSSETKLLEVWKANHGDCKNLLNPKFKHLGVAHAEGFWVVCLASPLE